MARPLARRRLYYGWYIIAVNIVINFFRVGYTGFLFGIFLKPMTEEFGWTRATVAGAVTVGTLMAAGMAAFFGRIIDRRGPQTITAITALLMGLSLFALAGTRTVIWFYVFYAIGRSFAQATLGDTVTGATISKWFVRNRGQAIAIASIGGPLGGAVLAVVTQRIIDVAGWRVAWASFGVYILVFVVPLTFLFLRRTPEDYALRPDGDSATPAVTSVAAPAKRPRRIRADISVTFSEAVRTRSFWIMCMVTAFGSLSATGISFHFAPRLTDVGIPPAAAAGAIGIYTLVQAVCVMGWGWLGDRGPSRLGMIASLVLSIAGIALVAYAKTPVEAYVAAFVYGIAQAGWGQMTQVVWADYFGRQHLGSIRGLSMLFSLIGNAMGSFTSALVYDLTGDYLPAFLGFLVVLTACLIATLVIAPPRRVVAPAA